MNGFQHRFYTSVSYKFSLPEQVNRVEPSRSCWNNLKQMSAARRSDSIEWTNPTRPVEYCGWAVHNSRPLLYTIRYYRFKRIKRHNEKLPSEWCFLLPFVALSVAVTEDNAGDFRLATHFVMDHSRKRSQRNLAVNCDVSKNWSLISIRRSGSSIVHYYEAVWTLPKNSSVQSLSDRLVCRLSAHDKKIRVLFPIYWFSSAQKGANQGHQDKFWKVAIYYFRAQIKNTKARIFAVQYWQCLLNLDQNDVMF